jgi:uncharacterized protein DUF2334
MVRLVFDDGGFTTSNPDGSGFRVPASAYDRLIQFARESGVRMGLACTAKFFDVEGRLGSDGPGAGAEDLIELLQRNRDVVEVYNHGLRHEHEGEHVEFLSYRSGPVPAKIQAERLELAQQILTDVGFEPTVFVPPGHAWERGVTDRIAHEVGLKAIAIRQFEKKPLGEWLRSPGSPYRMSWEPSEVLETHFRLGLGLRFDQTSFSRWNGRKLGMIFQGGVASRMIIHRRASAPIPPSHYFAHVQNLSHERSIPFFREVISHIQRAHADPLDR